MCGFGGSAAVEIVMLHQLMQDDRELPERYHRLAFWVVRTLLAVVGGGLALAYDIDKPLLAANIGAATPLIIKAFSEGLRPSGLHRDSLARHTDGVLMTVTAEEGKRPHNQAPKTR